MLDHLIGQLSSVNDVSCFILHSFHILKIENCGECQHSVQKNHISIIKEILYILVPSSSQGRSAAAKGTAAIKI